MSTSLLYHAFGIRGYDYVRTDYLGGEVIFTIAQDAEDRRCSACGSRDVSSRGHAERRFRNLPIGERSADRTRGDAAITVGDQCDDIDCESALASFLDQKFRRTDTAFAELKIKSDHDAADAMAPDEDLVDELPRFELGQIGVETHHH